MNWADLHLMANHFPIILGVTGTLAGVAAALAHSAALWRFAFLTVLLAGLTAPVAYFTGLQAEESVEHLWYVVEEQVEEHEELGLFALVGLLVAGATAALAWWRERAGWRYTFLVVALVASLLTGYTALEGGEIVHDSPVLRERPEGAAEETPVQPVPGAVEPDAAAGTAGAPDGGS